LTVSQRDKSRGRDGLALGEICVTTRENVPEFSALNPRVTGMVAAADGFSDGQNSVDIDDQEYRTMRIDDARWRRK
jgi:hypothetical protein